MENIKIDNIKKKENIREDYGDLTELTESVRAHGMRQPIILNSEDEIIDGHRRVIAAKAAGLKEVPFFYANDRIDERTSQMIAGIFQKNLNPVEEGKAFAQYIETEGVTIEQLAVRISKRQNYVEKRLEIAKLPVKVQTALVKNKIQMGHALLLARISGEARDELMKEIIDDELGVQEAKDNMSYRSMNLEDAKFCKGDCKDCIHNGSKQAELFETGTILNGNCMNSKCFNKKLREFVYNKRKEFADILYEGESYTSPEGYIDGDHAWKCTEFKITDAYKKKCREKRENYLVKVDDSGRFTEYFKKRPQKVEAGEVEVSEEKVEKKETALLTKVSAFKTQFLIEQTKEKVQPGTIEAKKLGVLRIIQQADYEEKDRAAEEIGKLMEDECGAYANVKNIFAADDMALDNTIAVLSKNALRGVDLKNLVLISRNFGVDIKTDFVITEDYLKMYTKDQLSDLIKEFKLEEAGNVKKAELIVHILQQNLKGKVPQIML